MVQSTEICKENYQPGKYQGTPPTPMNKIHDQLPWDQFNKDELSQAEERKEREKETEEKKKEDEAKGGMSALIGKASEAVAKVSEAVGEGFQKITNNGREKIEESQRQRMGERFPLGDGERLMYEYTCNLISADKPTSGYLYVTTQHLAFWSDLGDYHMKLFIPWAKIMSLQRGITKDKEEGKGVHINLVTNQDLKTDALLVYTNDKDLHSLFKFHAVHDPVSDYNDHALNVIDHAWRCATNKGDTIPGRT